MPAPRQSALELARELISRPSVTPGDAGCQELLARRLEALGFAIEHVPCGSVSNLWARLGRERPLVCFAGHTDVVPSGPADRWDSDPFTPAVRDGRLYGRGAADMKSAIAAFVAAVEDYLARGERPRGSIALLITSDEEGVAVDGTARVVERLRARGETIDYCIVGEPTSEARLGDTLKNGRRGSLSGSLCVRGVQGHVAYPHLARNPVHLAAPALAELAAMQWDRGDEDFPPTTWQVSNVRAGTGATNIIPGEIEVLFNFRYSAANSVEALRNRVEAVLARHRLDYTLEWSLSAAPYLTPRGTLVEALAAAVTETTGIVPDTSTGGGTSDGRFIAEICPQVVELGFLNATIHKLNENVPLEDIDALHRIYLRALEKLLAR